MCGTIDPGSCIRWVLGFGTKTGYDRSGFRATFCAHHIPQGVIKLKKKEFQDLKRGSMSVNVYVTKFTQLSRYAPHKVDTDEKK
jgi:hypothetical protein